MSTTIKIPEYLKTRLDEEAMQDPQWKNRSELARAILWEWIKDQQTQRSE